MTATNGPNPQFTLTCISIGGPATTVTWTRDSTTVTEGTETVLNNPLTAQYTHTLTVSGRPEGLYTCTVSNNKPSEDSAQLNVPGNGKKTAGAPETSSLAPSGSLEVFEADAEQRQVIFTWSPPPVTQRNGIITNYILSSQSESLTVTGFSPNTLYSCSVVATNSQGSGSSSTISFTTPEDCKTQYCVVKNLVHYSLYTDSYFQLHLHGLTSCPEFTVRA